MLLPWVGDADLCGMVSDSQPGQSLCLKLHCNAHDYAVNNTLIFRVLPLQEHAVESSGSSLP